MASNISSLLLVQFSAFQKHRSFARGLISPERTGKYRWVPVSGVLDVLNMTGGAIGFVTRN